MKKEKTKYKRELIIDETLGSGRLEYSSPYMRSAEEFLTFGINKGDKVYIYRKLRKNSKEYKKRLKKGGE